MEKRPRRTNSSGRPAWRACLCHPEPAKDPLSRREEYGSFVVPPQDDITSIACQRFGADFAVLGYVQRGFDFLFDHLPDLVHQLQQPRCALDGEVPRPLNMYVEDGLHLTWP